LRIDNEVRSEGAHPLYSALSRRGLDPSKLAYNPIRLDGQLRLTASAFNCASRAYWYAELAVSSQRWPKPTQVLIAPTHRGWVAWKILEWKTCQGWSPIPVLTGLDVALISLMWSVLRQTSH